MTEWISVKDRLPDKDGFVLIYNKYSPQTKRHGGYGLEISIKMFHQGFFYKRWVEHNIQIFHRYSNSVSHWMPLPSAPHD